MQTGIAKIAKQIAKIANSEILQKPDHAKIANVIAKPMQTLCKTDMNLGHIMNFTL